MIPVLTFFNNKGGVGKTSLIYHLAWIFSDMGKRVVAADLDPQANLTAAFLTDDEIESLWETSALGTTIYKCVKPLAAVSDIAPPVLKIITANLFLIPGDVALSNFEDTLSNEWLQSKSDSNLYRPLRILSAFWQVMQMASSEIGADIILVDIGPNLGAINRSALIATDCVVIPLGADLFSLQGLKNLGPALRDWKKSWNKCLDNWVESDEAAEYKDFKLPSAIMETIGYVCQQYSVHLSRPVKAYRKWVDRIPGVYSSTILNKQGSEFVRIEDDESCLAMIKHYRSLIPMSQEHRKPIFKLTPADGAIGSQAGAVVDARDDFRTLAAKIAERMGIENTL